MQGRREVCPVLRVGVGGSVEHPCPGAWGSIEHPCPGAWSSVEHPCPVAVPVHLEAWYLGWTHVPWYRRLKYDRIVQIVCTSLCKMSPRTRLAGSCPVSMPEVAGSSPVPRVKWGV